MIHIKRLPEADTRTCDSASASKQKLLEASSEHIRDVGKGLSFLVGLLLDAAVKHDYDKLMRLDWFFDNFSSGFERRDWWDAHRRMHRHHLDKEDGIPPDVNLLDVIEHVTDCVMAGMARSGTVYPVTLPSDLLQKAVANTEKLLIDQIVVEGA